MRLCIHNVATIQDTHYFLDKWVVNCQQKAMLTERYEIHKQINQTFEKIDLWGISHTNGTSRLLKKTPVVKELV